MADAEIVKSTSVSGADSRLLEIALEKGVGVETLERLVALQERASDRRAAAEFYSAMADFQRLCPSITKNKTAKIKTKTGREYSYTYAELDEIAGVVNPILAGLGLSYTWDSENDGHRLTCRCTLRHIGGHSVTSSFACPMETLNEMSGVQKAGAALTYARRQALVQVLGLTTTDSDPDGAVRDAAPKVEEEKIPASVLADMRAVLDEVGGDEERFCQYMKVDRLDDLPASRVKAAFAALEKRRRS